MKYFKLFMLFKDISAAYRNEKGKGRPFYLSRGFWAAVFIFLALATKVFLGIEIPDSTVQSLTDNITSISGSLTTVIPAIMAIYGVVMGIAKAAKAANVMDDPKSADAEEQVNNMKATDGK